MYNTEKFQCELYDKYCFKKTDVFLFFEYLSRVPVVCFRFNFSLCVNNCLEEKTSYRSSHQTYSIINGVLRNFAKFKKNYRDIIIKYTAEAHSEPSPTSKMELFAKIVNYFALS